jgi:hypothetical protein
MSETARHSAALTVRRLMRYPGRLALVIFGDHSECQRAPRIRTAPPEMGVASSDFSDNLREQEEWLRTRFVSMPSPYMDSALECALRRACELRWRERVRRRLFIMGESLPHHSPEANLRLRTGVECPAGIHWPAQLSRLRQLGISTKAAIPAPPDSVNRSFLMLLQREVWSCINENNEPYELDDRLPDRWGRELEQ